MTTALAIDGNNDFTLDATGNLATVSGLQAVIVLCKQAAQAQLGELVFDQTRGVPAQATVFSGAPNLAQYEAAIRAALQSVQDVTKVLSVTVKQSGGTLFYTATIQTPYGTTNV